MFKTDAAKVPSGNYLVEATCKGPHRHTVYKDQMNLNAPYQCPYDGYDVA